MVQSSTMRSETLSGFFCQVKDLFVVALCVWCSPYFGFGKRACERCIGPLQKFGALDMQRSADLFVDVDPLCSGGPMFPHEGRLCGSWCAMREVELSTARCMQVAFLNGEGCGRCVFNLPVTKTDPQALGKKRTHSVGGSETLCPVKVPWCSSSWTSWCSPNSSAVVAFCWRSVHHKKRCNTHVPEVGRVDGDEHQSHWGVVSHRGARTSG